MHIHTWRNNLLEGRNKAVSLDAASGAILGFYVLLKIGEDQTNDL